LKVKHGGSQRRTHATAFRGHADLVAEILTKDGSAEEAEKGDRQRRLKPPSGVLDAQRGSRTTIREYVPGGERKERNYLLEGIKKCKKSKALLRTSKHGQRYTSVRTRRENRKKTR